MPKINRGPKGGVVDVRFLDHDGQHTVVFGDKTEAHVRRLVELDYPTQRIEVLGVVYKDCRSRKKQEEFYQLNREWMKKQCQST